MGNYYVSQFKHTVDKFYEVVGSCRGQLDFNSKNFIGEALKDKNSGIQDKIESAYAKAVNEIKATFDEICNLLSVASFPSIESVTADRMFFNGEAPIVFDNNTIKTFIKRYWENFTMLKVILGYVETHKESIDGLEKLVVIETIKNRLPNAQVVSYKKFAETALSLLASIHSGNVAKNIVDNYGTENAINLKLYESIGSGFELGNFKNAKYKDIASDYFNDIKLSYTDGNVFLEL